MKLEVSSLKLSAMPKTTRHLDSVIRGCHVYMHPWDQVDGSKFNVEIEENNLHDQYVVKVEETLSATCCEKCPNYSSLVTVVTTTSKFING